MPFWLICRERYRDIIDAADSIQSMNAASQRLADILSNLRTINANVKKRPAVQPKPEMDPVYSIAAQLKFLVDAPAEVSLFYLSCQ